MSTTIEVSKRFHTVYRRWLKTKRMNSVEFMDKLIDEVSLKHQREFYLSLPDPRQIKNKPLSNIKLHKNYRK